MLKWGIIGVGRAGQARAAAIRADPRGAVGAGFRGEPEQAGLIAAESVEALLSAVDAVAICSPDDTHPALVRQALQAGCHVVCEFPLAQTAAEARELLDLADACRRVLHVEHIELLGGAAQWWRQQAIGTVSEGVVRFTSSRQSVSAVDGGLARLHRIVDILGLPQALRVTERSHTALSAALRWPVGEVALDFRSAPGLPRHTFIGLSCGLGRCEQRSRAVFVDDVPVTLPAVPGLFAADQRAATARILDGAASYLPRQRLLAVLALRDALRTSAPGGWQVFSPPG